MQSLMPTTPAERLLWLALLLLVACFMAGQWLNRQHAKRAGKWIQGGLGVLGGTVKWHWSKSISAGAEAMVEGTRSPFRNVAIAYYLLTREFPPLWLWEQLRGKHDIVAVRANLKFTPTREFEIVPVGGQLRKKLDETAAPAAAGEEPDQPFAWQELSNRMGFGMRGAIDEAACEKAKAFLRTYGGYVERVSLRKRSPHMLAFFRLGPAQTRPSGPLWQALGELAKN